MSKPDFNNLAYHPANPKRFTFGLDFETFGSRDLPSVGLDNYVADPNFRPLIASIAYLNKYHDIVKYTFDFVLDPKAERDFFRFIELGWMPGQKAASVFSRRAVAHNAGFERRVLRKMGMSGPTQGILDSAVIARAWGASSKLENAAPQLLGAEKMPDGRRLIKKFSIGEQAPTADEVRDDPDWALFKEYCELDAELSLRIQEEYDKPSFISDNEPRFETLTHKMNLLGWPVDMAMVEAMQVRYLQNLDELIDQFTDSYGELNFNSLKKMKEWTAARGVRCTSFDEAHVEKYLNAVQKKLQSYNDAVMNKQAPPFSEDKAFKYSEVFEMLRVKQQLGGSSLSKLPKIMALTSEDNRLRDQYLHCGAGQTRRTSGRGVQLQNLKRLHGRSDVETIFDPTVPWTNEELAANLRQVFTSDHPDGQLIVGDFSSVESRGLAYLAGEDWKIKEYFEGKDMYRVNASKFYNKSYEEIKKESPERQFGKVGELSCGYGAGSGAVSSFAAGMGVILEPEEAQRIVTDWRAANPMIVKFWQELNDAMLTTIQTGEAGLVAPHNGLQVQTLLRPAPDSLAKLHPGVSDLIVELWQGSTRFLARVFNGVHMRGRDIGYYKARDRATGQVWQNSYTDPKTKQRQFYKLYGGKLAGILTQSFCREIFFRSITQVETAFAGSGVELIGQFHDEIVLNWNPDKAGLTLEQTLTKFHDSMRWCSYLPWFPLEADIKHAYRYIK